jgi:ketosteroid isomerase-like protein
MELNDVRIDPLGEVATAFFNFRAQGRLKGRPTPHQPTGRVTMIFLHTPPGWRAIHYHESALAARA